jgi:hypothetical protein
MSDRRLDPPYQQKSYYDQQSEKPKARVVQEGATHCIVYFPSLGESRVVTWREAFLIRLATGQMW